MYHAGVLINGLTEAIGYAQGANALAGCCDRAVADGVTSYPELAARFGELERQVAST